MGSREQHRHWLSLCFSTPLLWKNSIKGKIHSFLFRVLGDPYEIAIFTGLTSSSISDFIWFNLVFIFVANGVRTATFFVGRSTWRQIYFCYNFGPFSSWSFPPGKGIKPIIYIASKVCWLFLFPCLPVSNRILTWYLSFNIRSLDSSTSIESMRFHSQ